MNCKSQEDFKKNQKNQTIIIIVVLFSQMSNMETDLEIKVIKFSIYHKFNIELEIKGFLKNVQA